MGPHILRFSFGLPILRRERRSASLGGALGMRGSTHRRNPAFTTMEYSLPSSILVQQSHMEFASWFLHQTKSGRSLPIWTRELRIEGGVWGLSSQKKLGVSHIGTGFQAAD